MKNLKDLLPDTKKQIVDHEIDQYTKKIKYILSAKECSDILQLAIASRCFSYTDRQFFISVVKFLKSNHYITKFQYDSCIIRAYQYKDSIDYKCLEIFNRCR